MSLFLSNFQKRIKFLDHQDIICFVFAVLKILHQKKSSMEIVKEQMLLCWQVLSLILGSLFGNHVKCKILFCLSTFSVSSPTCEAGGSILVNCHCSQEYIVHRRIGYNLWLSTSLDNPKWWCQHLENYVGEKKYFNIFSMKSISLQAVKSYFKNSQ